MSEIWNTSVEQAKRPLDDATTQHHVRSTIMPLSRRHRSDRMHAVEQLTGDMATRGAQECTGHDVLVKHLATNEQLFFKPQGHLLEKLVKVMILESKCCSYKNKNNLEIVVRNPTNT